MHAGHFKLIELASAECDSVIVFVSTSDRKRSGEFFISGETMHKIWREMIESILPANVTPEYGGSPVRKIYDTLGAAETSKTSDKEYFIIYSDQQDINDNFSENNRRKYFPILWNSKRVTFRAVNRMLTGGISGTTMRNYLSNNDKQSFISNLPAGLDGNTVWNKLRGSIQEQQLLRSYINNVMHPKK
jgi:nicotinamide mononucleotide adenylyltransferase